MFFYEGHSTLDPSDQFSLFFLFLNVSHRYLTGFTLFLSLILNRTFFMILDLLQSEEKMDTIRNEVLTIRHDLCILHTN
jgi:hypothetical protein